MSSTERTPLKILHVTFNMGIGGTEQVIRQLINGLPKDRFINSVACIDDHVGEIGKQVREQGVEVFALARNPGFDLELVRKIREEIRGRDIDVVHCHQYTPWIYGAMAATGLKARVIFTEHGRFHPDRYRYKAMLLNPLMALATDGIVAISEATKCALSRYEFIPPRKIQVIYNGIRGLEVEANTCAALRQELGISESELVLGTVARLDPVKNQPLMLEAFASLLEERPNCRLLMVGDGPERSNLEDKAQELGIATKTIFTGFEREPGKYLAIMDLFLLSSHTEGTSMTLLEAMSLGIPVVATRVGGNPEIVIHEETGLLTAPDSARGFANAIKALANDEAEREQLSQQSTALFTRAFSQQRMIDSYVALYVRAGGIEVS